MIGPHSPLAFARGPAMKNCFARAPLTNPQSHADGRLSSASFLAKEVVAEQVE